MSKYGIFKKATGQRKCCKWQYESSFRETKKQKHWKIRPSELGAVKVQKGRITNAEVL